MTNMLGFIGNLAPGEILLLVVVILFLFGAKRIPDLARAMGRSVKEFKKGRDEPLEDKDEDNETSDVADATKKPEPKA